MKLTNLMTNMACTLICLSATFSSAQENPLRGTRLRADSQAHYQYPIQSQSENVHQSESIHTASNANYLQNTQTFQPSHHQPVRTIPFDPAIQDAKVIPATFNKPPIQNNFPRSEQAPSLNATAVSDNWTSPRKILDLIMKLSLNLIFVLSFAVGVILLAKRWAKDKDVTHDGERAKSDSLSVIQTLRIDPKTSLKLVQWRTNRFLIACDQNGIQSVNSLNESFDQTLAELDKEEESDEELLKKLLSSLEASRAA
ncbi:MAG: flagellar biosynthetic protein FliO [Planctomycetota bacterium]